MATACIPWRRFVVRGRRSAADDDVLYPVATVRRPATTACRHRRRFIVQGRRSAARGDSLYLVATARRPGTTVCIRPERGASRVEGRPPEVPAERAAGHSRVIYARMSA